MFRPQPSRNTVEKWIKDLPELEFDGIQLRCKACNVILSWQVKTRVVKHVSSDAHKARVAGTATSRERQKAFNSDVLKMLIACNIPWNTANHPEFTHFLQNCVNGKYRDLHVPAESTLKEYMSPMYDQIMTSIVSDGNDERICFSENETTDSPRKEKIKNPIKIIRKYKCIICEEKFWNKTNLEEHQLAHPALKDKKNHHGVSSKRNKKIPNKKYSTIVEEYLCTICNGHYTTKKALHDHHLANRACKPASCICCDGSSESFNDNMLGDGLTKEENISDSEIDSLEVNGSVHIDTRRISPTASVNGEVIYNDFNDLESCHIHTDINRSKNKPTTTSKSHGNDLSNWPSTSARGNY